jgi:hypothetical protein
MRHFFMPSANSPALEWAGLIGILLLLFICLALFVVWFKTGRTGKARRRKRKRHHQRHLNPTLAQTGGLPPKRDPNTPPPGP